MTHPITPPPELVQEWWTEAIDQQCHSLYRIKHLANRSAQYGADQELEACCDWLHEELKLTLLTLDVGLRAARRPKPPSLKDEAMNALAWVDKHLDMPLLNHFDAIHTIRRALEALPE
jgi:hypothetical protein